MSSAFGWTTSKSRAHGLEGQTNKGNTVIGVCYTPTEQEKVDEGFHRQLEVASQSQALVLVEDFTLTPAGETTGDTSD